MARHHNLIQLRGKLADNHLPWRGVDYAGSRASQKYHPRHQHIVAERAIDLDWRSLNVGYAVVELHILTVDTHWFVHAAELASAVDFGLLAHCSFDAPQAAHNHHLDCMLEVAHSPWQDRSADKLEVAHIPEVLDREVGRQRYYKAGLEDKPAAALEHAVVAKQMSHPAAGVGVQFVA